MQIMVHGERIQGIWFWNLDCGCINRLNAVDLSDHQMFIDRLWFSATKVHDECDAQSVLQINANIQTEN